jgi:hypothetical protein
MDLIFKHFAKLGETLCERITRLVSSLLDCFILNPCIKISLINLCLQGLFFFKSRKQAFYFFDKVVFMLTMFTVN